MQPSSVTRCEGVIKASYRDAWQMAEITGVFCGRVARDKVGDVSHFTVCAYEECLYCVCLPILNAGLQKLLFMITSQLMVTTLHKWHGGSVACTACTAASQQEGHGFDSRMGRC